MNTLIKSRGAVLVAALGSLLLGAAACSSESGASGEAATGDVRTAASSLTTGSTGVTQWVAHREGSERGLVIEGRDAAGATLTVIESHGGPHTASLSVDADLLEMNDQAGILTDTLSAHSLEVIQHAKEDLEGTPAEELLRAVPPSAGESAEIGTTSQAATTKPTTTTANCFACWLVTVGTGAEFCYKYGHCDN